NVIMPTKKIGDKVNLEVDMLGKYVEKLIESKLFSSINSSSSNENVAEYVGSALERPAQGPVFLAPGPRKMKWCKYVNNDSIHLKIQILEYF
ncbi:12002_t:CDS:2, partial [Entrophospora sp. SA101]